VRAVHVAFGHHVSGDSAPVGVEFVVDPGAEAVISSASSSFERHLVERGLLDVQDLPLQGRVAWYFRSRPIFAEPPAESPSTR